MWDQTGKESTSRRRCSLSCAIAWSHAWWHLACCRHLGSPSCRRHPSGITQLCQVRIHPLFAPWIARCHCPPMYARLVTYQHSRTQKDITCSVQRGGNLLPVRGSQVRQLPRPDTWQVRQDDPGHDLGFSSQWQDLQDEGLHHRSGSDRWLCHVCHDRCVQASDLLSTMRALPQSNELWRWLDID
jgi:hypothetical protein